MIESKNKKRKARLIEAKIRSARGKPENMGLQEGRAHVAEFNVIMQEWTYGDERGKPDMTGWDVVVVGNDGKVEKLYAMIEGAATHNWA